MAAKPTKTPGRAKMAKSPATGGAATPAAAKKAPAKGKGKKTT